MGKLATLCIKVNKFLRKLDLFPTNSFICYNGDTQYTTATGGFVSIAVIIIFVVLFASMGIRTVNRQIIQASTSIENDANPPALSIITSPSNNFMFSINIFGVDLNNKTFQLFDVSLLQTYYGPGYSLINQTAVPLVKCTDQHFAFDSSIAGTLNNFQMDRGLCPPIGYQLAVGGKATSNSSSFLNVLITRCKSASNPACANDIVFGMVQAALGGDFMLVMPIINTVINPADSSYKTIYIEDRNAFTFNSQMGIYATGRIQEAVVNTDISILPSESIVSETFTVIPDLFTAVPFLKSSLKPYANILFSKATNTVTYTRSFSKVDAYFSYVGGLVGTIIGLIFILQFYTQKAFEISISHRLFKNSDDTQIDSSSFNILYFFLMVVKGFLNLFSCPPMWTKTQKFIDCCDQISFQLDISYVLRKLMFLETAVDVIFKTHHVQALYLKDKPSIEKAKSQRKKYFRPQLVGEYLIRKNELEDERRESLTNNFNFDSLPPQKRQISSISHKVSDISASSINQNSEIQEIEQCIDKVMHQSREGNSNSTKILTQMNQKFLKASRKIQQNQKTLLKIDEGIFELKISEIQNHASINQK